MPNFRSPRSASPESFSSTRRYLAAALSVIGGSLFAQREALEAPDVHVLAGGRGDGRHQILDRLRGVADVGLAEQLVDVGRRHRGDLHRELLGELAELVTARDEVRLARQLNERADTAIGVDVRRDDALARFAAALLRGLVETALGDERLRLVVVALRVLERALAVHDAGAGLGPEARDVLGVDLCHQLSSAGVSASAVTSSSRPPIGYSSSSSSGSYTRGVRFARGTPMPSSSAAVVDGAYPMSSGVASLRLASN